VETYFHSDPRIQEWVDQITEKLFTVCLLTGNDSEVEFQKGSQIVTKVTQLLQGISMFPSEYLEDGLKQLLEQQLPDSRVINNFPTFQDTMNKMLHEGMTRAIDTQNKENLKNLPEIIINTPESKEENSSVNDGVYCDDNPGKAYGLNDEFDTERVMSALASVNSSTTNLGEAEVEQLVPELEELMDTKIDSSIAIASPIVPSTLTKPYGIIRKTQVPDQASRLKNVLSSVFPNVSVCWNLNLMGQSFLAQVEDILICLDNPEQPCPVENLNKEGWKVYVCSADDLMFPRRLERGIKQIQRLGKLCKKG